jgi:DNA-directed RNA polymerase specialized sigma24 family protein
VYLSVINDGQIQLLEKLEQAENKQHIIDCLKTLNSRTQDAIFMQYFHHKTYAQIAKQLFTPKKRKIKVS